MDVLAALFPSVGVALIFWFVIRAMLQGDRRERAAMAELDRQDRERAAREDGAPGSGPPPHSSR